MKASPFLYIPKKCQEAIKFYKELGFNFIKEIYYSEDIEAMGIKKGDVQYASFNLGDTRVDMDSTGDEVIGSLILDFEENEKDKLNFIWDKLKEEGKINLALKQFKLIHFDAMMGIVIDKFGITWQFHMVIPWK